MHTRPGMLTSKYITLVIYESFFKLKDSCACERTRVRVEGRPLFG
jgi:hypothetical protein